MKAFDGIAAARRAVARAPVRRYSGRVTSVHAQSIEGALLGAKLGAVCRVSDDADLDLAAEVIAITGTDVVLSPFGKTDGCTAGAWITVTKPTLQIPVSDGLLGRVIDVFGTPLDGAGPVGGVARLRPVRQPTANAMTRPVVDTPFVTGISAIDAMLTLGVGQRVGLFGPPGTGKTSLLGMLARQCDAQVVVIGLVGERGREVREFVEEVLPADLRRRAVVVAATSDRPAIERSVCALTATTVAEHFRDAGANVFLLIDSLTRTARALREIGLAAGEAPTRRGYPASVYPALPGIIERAGRSEKGDITAVYTVLTEGDMESDPIAEEVRSLTDGHFVLSRKLAEKSHYPALDIQASLSRTMPRIVDADHMAAALSVRRGMAKYDDIALLVQMGEYEEGTDAEADRAIEVQPSVETLLRQDAGVPGIFAQTVATLRKIGA